MIRWLPQLTDPVAGTSASSDRSAGMSKDYPNERERLTPQERKTRDASRRWDAEQARREHELAQQAFHKNRERLKAERLAREGFAKK